MLRTAALMAALLALGARDGRAADRWMVVHRLADEVAAMNGQPEPPVATIGYTTRYVLAAMRSVLLQPMDPLPAEMPAAGTVQVRARCPDDLVGVDFSTGILSAARIVTSRNLSTCAAKGDVVSLQLAAEPGRKLSPAGVALGVPPQTTVTTGWLAIPAGARLHAAIGIASPRPITARARTRFRVSTETADGRHAVLVDHELDPQQQAADVKWVDVDVPIEAAERVRLTFDTEAAAGERSFGVWADPVILAPGSPPSRRNVLLISLDTLRADRLGAYGAPRHTSPFLDQLAARSALFEPAYSSAPHTFPSHATILTGLYSCASGAGFGSLTLFQPFPRAVVPLAETLRRSGYVTAAFTEDAFVDASPFQRGFGSFRANKTATIEGAPTGDAPGTFADAAAWLRKHAAEQFFLFVHTYQVHEPYTAPALYEALFSPEDGSPEPDAAFNFRDLLAHYDAEIRYTDASLEQLFTEFDALGLADDTIVIVLSDHGQEFGEHGYHGHGAQMWNELLHVPMLWRAPGLIVPGRREGGMVGTVDVVPTLYALLGIPAPHELQGRSLAKTLTDNAPLDPDRFVIARGLADQPQSAIRWPRAKLIRFENGDPKWYDVVADPHELAPRTGAEAQRALRTLEDFERDCAELHRKFTAVAPATTPSIDPERDRNLRALGYVQ